MQLDLKTVGWGSSANPTRRRTELFADWIEAQALISGLGEAISKPDLVDRIEGTGLAKDSDDAWALVDDAFSVCRTRKKLIDAAYPFLLEENAIQLESDEGLPYVFCLLVSLPEQLKVLRKAYSTEFRDLFEALVAEALQVAMPEWLIFLTGWSSIADGGKGAIVGKVGEWTLSKKWDASVFPNANDAQIDIAVVRPFGDQRSAFPVFLGQCATGVTDWKQKASRPNLDRWNKAVQFSSNPTKLFAVPFALDEHSFWEATVECSGIVLDRVRICMKLPAASPELSGKIQVWLEKAKTTLPAAA